MLLELSQQEVFSDQNGYPVLDNIIAMICVLQHYTYIQPGEIRAKVDELLNCEDIFLNALVADLSMRPAVHAYLTRLTMFPLCER